MTNLERMLQAIRDAGAGGIAPRCLPDLIWAYDPDGGPLTANTVVRVMAHKLKKRGLIHSEGNTHRARYYARNARKGWRGALEGTAREDR